MAKLTVTINSTNAALSGDLEQVKAELARLLGVAAWKMTVSPLDRDTYSLLDIYGNRAGSCEYDLEVDA